MPIYQTPAPAPATATPSVTPGPAEIYEALANQKGVLRNQRIFSWRKPLRFRERSFHTRNLDGAGHPTKYSFSPASSCSSRSCR